MLAPGYGGSAEQPIIVAMGRKLAELGINAKPISYSRARPGGDLSPEIAEVRAARDALKLDRVALVGRSFGGRVCTRLAAVEPPTALVVLGHPISPRNRPRPEDEAALEAVRCPTLIVQGDHDALGPLSVLQRIARANGCLEIYVLKDTGHNFGGKRQAEGIAYAADWLSKVMHA